MRSRPHRARAKNADEVPLSTAVALMLRERMNDEPVPPDMRTRAGLDAGARVAGGASGAGRPRRAGDWCWMIKRRLPTLTAKLLQDLSLTEGEPAPDEAG